MKKISILLLSFIMMCSMVAQVDTLGKNPHLYYYDMPALGSHDSMTCYIKVHDYFWGYRSDLEEFAYYMHSDDTLHIIGIAYSAIFYKPWWYPNNPPFTTHRISLYDTTMKNFKTIHVDALRPDTLDSNYLQIILPNNNTEPGVYNYYIIDALRLAFFDGDTVDVCGDFYIGTQLEGLESDGVVSLIYEDHPEPYAFPTRPLRGYIRDTGWRELDGSYWMPHTIPLIFPILSSYRSNSDTTGIAGVAAADRQVGLSPNPATGRVQVTASCGMTEVAVYNAAGEQVHRQPASGHSATLDTGRWPAGVYIVHVETPLGRAVKKLVVR